MTNEIIYTNLAAKPTRPTSAPTPQSPTAQTQAPQVKRITWGIHGRLHMPATTERPQPPKDDSSAPRVRLSRGGAREMRSPEVRSVEPEAPRVRMRYVDRGSRLERIPGQRLLCEKLERQAARPALEHLTILHSPKAQGYWITDAETCEIFLPQAFITLEHCHEAAAELERIFHMAEVLKSRPAETMERVGELVQGHWMRERVAVALG